MDNNLRELDIRQLKALFPENADMNLGDDFIVADVRYDNALTFLQYPCKFNGFMAIFCLKGYLKLDINLRTYEIKEKSLVFNVPGYILRVSEYDESHLDDLRFLVVAMSREYMSSIRYDFNRLFNESMKFLDNPVLTMEGESLDISAEYISLLSKVLSSNLPDKKDVVGPLVSSLCHIVGAEWIRKINQAKTTSPSGVRSSRLNVTFETFVRLVTEYHESERNVSFYADHMCLTPKYLSKLIKQASGRSAPEWIDSFVILEAKNLLKYSDSAIKEIVYKLHFPNQSVFYKFFKAHTGMTPSEYRNG